MARGTVRVHQPEVWDMNRDPLSQSELAEALATLHPDWSGDTSQIRRKVVFPSFLTAVEFVGRMAPVAERLDHHPDLLLSWRNVELTLSTHSSGGVTAYDIALAKELDSLIDALLPAAP